ncbi:MAG: hypothetical protein SOZ27_08400 [Spirochaetia bacterium]|nr:hypothetical protein [Spirochaetia bacterium]
MKRLHLVVSFFCFSVLPLAAQQHLSVPLDDPVYRVIENAVIKNYIPALPTAKPYSRATVLSALREMIESPRILPLEKSAAEGMIARFESHKTEPWYQRGGYRYDSLTAVSADTKANEETLSDSVTEPENSPTDSHSVTEETVSGSEKKNKKPVYTTVEIGGSWQTDVDFGAFNKDGVFSTENWLELYLQGDLSEYFSYRFQTGMGITALSLNAYAPYTYSKSWDGYQFPFKDGTALTGFTEEPAVALQIMPELSLALWDRKLKFNFSRVRRDWGPGDGNLMISGTARPFMGLDIHLNPVDWFNWSFIVGVLEFDASSGGIKGGARAFQNAYTATMVEFFGGEWVYFSLMSSAVWPKRFELGYGHPGMLGILYQNMIGDFDNLQFGAQFGFNLPKYFRFYAGWFIDEMKFMDNFTHLDRNMYSWQVGGRLAVPGAPFTTVSLQYTKVEPYMYTHPKTDTPWYDQPMDTTYINHGEPLGYKLDPNSDELKLKVETMPLWYLNASLMYRMIRHGISADGSTYTDALNYSGDYNGAKPGDLYWKDFLKDGVYEWIHSIGIEAELDLRFVNVPIAIGGGYTFYYRYLTEYDSGTGKFNRLDTFEWNEKSHQTNMGNLFSLYIRVW